MSDKTTLMLVLSLLLSWYIAYEFGQLRERQALMPSIHQLEDELRIERANVKDLLRNSDSAACDWWTEPQILKPWPTETETK